MPIDGCFDVGGFALEGFSFLGHLPMGAPEENGKRNLNIFAKIFLGLSARFACGCGGYALWQAYDPQTQTQLLVDQIVLDMANKDPYEKVEEPGPHALEKDSWGNPVWYLRTMDEDSVTHAVRSAGADKMINTEDDLLVEIRRPYLVKSIGKSIGKGIKDLGKGIWDGIWN
jgi:hypothetical protein